MVAKVVMAAMVNILVILFVGGSGNGVNSSYGGDSADGRNCGDGGNGGNVGAQ